MFRVSFTQDTDRRVGQFTTYGLTFIDHAKAAEGFHKAAPSEAQTSHKPATRQGIGKPEASRLNQNLGAIKR